MRPFEAIAKDSTVGTVLSPPHYKQNMVRAKPKVEKKDSDGNALQRTQLLYAAPAGCDECVRDLLKNGVSPNVKNLRGRTPLHMAASQGFTSIVYQLLESGASPFTRDPSGDTPLDLAMKGNHQEVIQLLIRAIHNTDVRDLSLSIEVSGHSNAFNFIDSSLDSPLVHAVRQGKMKLVKKAIVSGSLEAKDSGGNTPLCVAAERGLHEIVSLLLNRGASVTAANNDGRTALHLAAMRGFKGIVEKLLNHCASPFIEDAYGATPLALAIFRKHKQVVNILEHAELKSVHITSNNSCRMTGLRAVRREPFNVAEKIDRSIVYSTKEKNKPISTSPIQILETLGGIQDDVNVEKQIERFFLTEQRAMNRKFQKDSDGNALQRTQLLYAAPAGCDECVRDLLKNGVSPNVKNLRGRTPLHMAASQGFTSIVYQLLESVASPFTRDPSGDTPLDLAMKGNHPEVIQLLIRSIRNSDLRDIFSWSIEVSGHSNAFNFSDSSLDSSLVHAVRQGKMKLVKKAIVSGSLEAKDSGGNTPLCVAAERGLHAIVSLLLDHGASVTAANNDGRTALHLAAMRGFKGIVEKLLNHRASPFTPDAYGETPLALAIFRKHKQVIKILQHAEFKSVDITSNNSCRMTGLRAVRREPFNSRAEKIDRSIVYSAKEKNKPIRRSPIQSHEKLGGIQDHVNVEKQMEVFFLTEQRAMNRKFYQLQERRNWQGAQNYKLIVTKFWERRRMREKMIRARKRWLIAQNRAVLGDEESYDAMKCTEKNVVTPAHVTARGRLTQEKVRFLRRGDRRAKHRAAKRAALAARNFFGTLERMRLAKFAKRQEHSPNPEKFNIMEKMTQHRSVNSKRIAKQCAPESQDKKNLTHIAKNDVACMDKSGATDVHKAARRRNTNGLETLLKDGASVDTKDKNGRTPLHQASWTGRIQCVRVLLQFGANLLAKDEYGSSPLHLAASNNHVDCVAALIAGGADIMSLDAYGRTPLHVSALKGHVTCVIALIDQGTPVDFACKNETERTALHLAALKGHLECVSMLLQKNAAVGCVDRSRRTALHLATRNGHAECVRFLLENGAQVDLRDNFGDSALHTAAFIGSVECVSVLLESGARVDSAGRQLRTALHVAAYKGRASCVRLLLDSGASVEARDEFSSTVLHAAAKGGNVETARLLVAAGASCTAKNNRNLTPLDVARGDDVRSLLMRQ